jgi:preprotein translocase subunit SecD
MPQRRLNSSIGVVVAFACCVLAGCAAPQAGHVLTFAPDQRKLSPGTVPDPSSLVTVINNRIGRAGRARVAEGGSVVVEIYRELDDQQLESVKRLISSPGLLEFRIVAEIAANSVQQRNVIGAAMTRPGAEKDVVVDGQRVAEWVAYAADGSNSRDGIDGSFVQRTVAGQPEVLVLIDRWNVTGDFLTEARIDRDAGGQPAILFTLNSAGASRMTQLTSQNMPNPATGDVRTLGIILDKRLISAPRIMSAIGSRGQISGGGLTQPDVENILAILHAGALPYPIRLVNEQANVPTNSLRSVPSPAIFVVLACGVAVLLIVGIGILVMKTRPR